MNSKLTYCNLLSMEDIKSGRWLDANLTGADERTRKDYRSISDPSVVYHDGKWIMYPSYAVAYVSEDFVHWKHVDIGVPHMRYSPAVVCFRGKWYLSGHGMSEVYVADDPLGKFTLAGHLADVHGNEMKVADGCYLADGDRLYFYWFKRDPDQTELDVEAVTGTDVWVSIIRMNVWAGLSPGAPGEWKRSRSLATYFYADSMGNQRSARQRGSVCF